MKSMNVSILCGRLVRDPELKTLSTGTAVSEITLAVSDDYRDTKRSYFFDCKVWGKGAETLCKYSKKGDTIIVNGELKQDTWEAKDGTKRNKVFIDVVKFQFVGGKKESGENDNAVETVDEMPETFAANSMEGF